MGEWNCRVDTTRPLTGKHFWPCLLDCGGARQDVQKRHAETIRKIAAGAGGYVLGLCDVRKVRIILRMMRKSRLLNALISRTKQEILAATVLQPERSWYLLELARHLRVRPSSLQRELRLLAEAGILQRWQNGNRVYFRADRACPIFRPLGEILFKTIGVVEALHTALYSLKDEIEVAFVYGSVAEAAERSASDIDLMVIGSATLSAIAPLLREPERRLGRAINPTIYTEDEFEARLREGRHFLTSVLRKEPLFIIGGPDELAKLTSSVTSAAAPHQSARNRRSARSH